VNSRGPLGSRLRVSAAAPLIGSAPVLLAQRGFVGFVDIPNANDYCLAQDRTMLEIITLGDERLKRHSIVVPELDGEVQALVEQMFEAMYANKGVGLAAVQVGRLLRLFITHVPEDVPRVFVNPEIVETSLEQGAYEEGCLSIPGVNADVLRPSEVKIQAWNGKARPFTLDVEGFLARVVQHEIDHLNGVLFIERIDPKRRERLVKQYQSARVS
jgi:peptide deformylase